ncbi:MAG: hypothetical protein AAB250_14140 [Bdellovibrionota bacterium]
MKIRLLISTIVVCVSTIGVAQEKAAPPATRATVAADDCALCRALDAIREKHEQQTKSAKPDFNRLQIEASESINARGKQTGNVLNGQEIASFVKFMRLAVPVDPSRAIVENTLDVIEKNQDAIEAQMKTLPKEEANSLILGINLSLGARGEPPDSPPPKISPKKKK